MGQKTFVKRTYYDEEKTQLKEIVTLMKSDSSLHGKYQSLYLNGSLSVAGYYDHNLSDSTWIYYFENGSGKTKLFNAPIIGSCIFQNRKSIRLERSSW